MSSPSQLPRLVTVRAAGAVTSSDSFPVGAEEELYQIVCSCNGR